MFELRFCTGGIDLEAHVAEVRSDADGAVLSFVGVVRESARGRRVLRLEYEAWPAMAERQMRAIFHEARDRFGLERALVVHRTGVLRVGQPSVAVVVATPHRGEAFDACRYLIDQLKERVPIWKKEIYVDGEAWIGERS